jgi:hypothetical protein
MYRHTIALALAAAASAQVEVTSETVSGNQRLMARRQVVTDITDFENRINLNMAEAAANAQIQAERAASNATIAATATMYNQIQALQQTSADAQANLNAQISSLTATVQTTLSASTSTINAQISTLSARVDSQLEAASTANAAAAAEASTALAAGISTASAAATQMVLVRNTATTCSTAGHIKLHPTSGKIEVCDGQRYKASVPTVTHRGYDSSQGCENCYPGHRDIVFRKHYADTYLRVIWYDNSRMYGWHGRRGTWHIRVCDANGNGCADCNDPGKMMADKYTWAEHGWRTNLHHPTQVTALCRRTTNRQLNPGQYKIRVWLASGHDAYTGHHGQYGSLQVEEVYKA